MSDSAGPLSRPHIRIRPSSGWSLINLREIWQYRDLLLSFAERDVKLRYRQTALGAIWVLVQPIVSAGIFSFVFGKLAKMPSDGLPYFMFSFSAMLGWQAFSATLTKASSSLVGNSNLITKVYFPRMILPLSYSFSVVIDFLVASTIMVVLLIVYRDAAPLTPAIFLVPVWLSLLICTAMGLGLMNSSLAVTYRDFQYIIPVIVPMLLYASPVAYTASKVPADWQWLYFLNPLAGLITAFRWSILGRGDVPWAYVGYSAVFAIAVLFYGAHVFRKNERRFADVI